MSINAVAHLNFHGLAREALAFYESVFGGQATVIAYRDFGMPKDHPDADKVVWGQVVSDNGFRLMAYDVPSQRDSAQPNRTTEINAAPRTRRENGMTLTSEPFFLSVRGETVEEVRALWDKLASGATIVEPYGPAQWAPAFGMLTDRYAVTWILDVAAKYAEA